MGWFFVGVGYFEYDGIGFVVWVVNWLCGVV